MFCGEKAKKCIIMQFLGWEKDRKDGKSVLNAVPNPEGSGSGAEYAEKRFESTERKRGMVHVRGTSGAPNDFFAKSFISTHIARDRCKSFISNT
jgi:hypothetical protein